MDEAAVNAIRDRFSATRQATMASLQAGSNLPTIGVNTTLEYGAQRSNEESHIFGLVTLQAPSMSVLADDPDSPLRVPLDLICVVDQSGSMSGEKINLLKRTLNYIVEQLNENDRLAVVSFNTTAFDRSRGLKRMTQAK